MDFGSSVEVDVGCCVAVLVGVSVGGFGVFVGKAAVEVTGTIAGVDDGSMVSSWVHPVTRVRISIPITLSFNWIDIIFSFKLVT